MRYLLRVIFTPYIVTVLVFFCILFYHKRDRSAIHEK